MNRLNENANLNNINKKITILSFTHVGDSRYIKIKKQNVLTLIRIYNKFIFLLLLFTIRIEKKSKKTF